MDYARSPPQQPTHRPPLTAGDLCIALRNAQLHATSPVCFRTLLCSHGPCQMACQSVDWSAGQSVRNQLVSQSISQSVNQSCCPSVGSHVPRQSSTLQHRVVISYFAHGLHPEMNPNCSSAAVPEGLQLSRMTSLSQSPRRHKAPRCQHGMQHSYARCGAPQDGAVQCSAVQCSAVQRSAVQCSAVQCSAVQCSAVQCSAVQCRAVQDGAGQRSTAEHVSYAMAAEQRF